MENKNLRKLLDSGIPVWRAKFHGSVDNADDTPEEFFSSKSNVKSRNVKMTWTPGGLICEHKGKIFLVSSSMVKYVNFDFEEEKPEEKAE